jgi:hypothetical protein
MTRWRHAVPTLCCGAPCPAHVSQPRSHRPAHTPPPTPLTLAGACPARLSYWPLWTLAPHVHCRSWARLERFTRLETLVLDKNDLPDLAGCPRLEGLKTLWFNKNRVTDLAGFLDQVAALFPRLVGGSLPRQALAWTRCASRRGAGRTYATP